MRISRVSLYDCASNPHIVMDEVASFISDSFGTPARARPPPRLRAGEVDACRVRSLFRPPELWRDGDRADADLYDGHLLADVLGRGIAHPDGEYHLFFVDRMVGTYDGSDMKYHGRAVVSANPAIISVRGMCEAPARPRRYYTDMMACAAGGDPAEVESRHAGSFLTPDDPRIGDAARGYAMQAMFHFETGEAFCGDARCRLFNSHWQSDLIRTQTDSPRLCGRHRDMLRRMR